MPAINPDSLLKYRLKELWVRNFGAKCAEMKKEFLKQNPPLHIDTLSADFNVLIGEGYTVSKERLAKYAEFLNVEVDVLRNRYNIAA